MTKTTQITLTDNSAALYIAHLEHLEDDQMTPRVWTIEEALELAGGRYSRVELTKAVLDWGAIDPDFVVMRDELGRIMWVEGAARGLYEPPAFRATPARSAAREALDAAVYGDMLEIDLEYDDLTIVDEEAA